MLSVREVSKKLQLSRETVRTWIRNGRLKATQLQSGGKYQISEEDLREFLRECSVNTPPNINSQYKK